MNTIPQSFFDKEGGYWERLGEDEIICEGDIAYNSRHPTPLTAELIQELALKPTTRATQNIGQTPRAFNGMAYSRMIYYRLSPLREVIQGLRKIII